MSPKAAERIPLEWFWPLLQRISTTLEARPEFEHDWLARASVRVAYYLSCPATRAHFVSAAREMALDPAFGPDGTWTRLERLALPAAFVWGERDALIPAPHAAAVADVAPARPSREGRVLGAFHERTPSPAASRPRWRSAVLHTLEAPAPRAPRAPDARASWLRPASPGASPSAEAAAAAAVST